MQYTSDSYNLDFLNKYFSTKEFSFINNANSENKKLDDLISKELLKRDFFVEFINNLNTYMYSTSKTSTLSEISSILSELQQIFQKINENISTLQNCRKLSAKISENIVNLLLNVEANHGNSSTHTKEIGQLKDSLNEFSITNEQIQSAIFLTNLKIDVCLKKENVKKYIYLFNMNKNFENTDEVSVEPKQSYSKFVDITIPQKSDDNKVLIISEKQNKVYLPYSQKELLLYLEQYPNKYKSEKDVIKTEFEIPLDYYMKHPVIARFRETYSLIRDREVKSSIDAFKYAINLMFHYELNPAIIAACKTEQQLENYLECQEKNKLNEFKDFEIRFEVLPKSAKR